MNRVGIGHDTHRLEAGRKLILGGILVEYPRGLAGHSDADIVLHALTDAILGAAGLGDIGDAFPDTDAARVLELHRCGVLDSEADPSFDHISELARRVAGTDIGIVSLVDAIGQVARKWLDSRFVGFAGCEAVTAS